MMRTPVSASLKKRRSQPWFLAQPGTAANKAERVEERKKFLLEVGCIIDTSLRIRGPVVSGTREWKEGSEGFAALLVTPTAYFRLGKFSLFGQKHFFHIAEMAGLHFAEIDAAGHGNAVIISAVPADLIGAGRFELIHQRTNTLT